MPLYSFMNSTLVKLGKECKEYRNSINMLQLDVAIDTDYSVESISAFERGRNNNLKIFLWYVENGYNVNDFLDRIGKDK